MNPFKFLANFNVEFWYKMCILMGIMAVVLALMFPIHVISNGSLLAIGFGHILLGLGEWMNHPKQLLDFNPLLGYTFHTRGRLNCLGGVLFDLAGLILIVAGLIAAVYSAFS